MPGRLGNEPRDKEEVVHFSTDARRSQEYHVVVALENATADEIAHHRADPAPRAARGTARNRALIRGPRQVPSNPGGLRDAIEALEFGDGRREVHSRLPIQEPPRELVVCQRVVWLDARRQMGRGPADERRYLIH